MVLLASLTLFARVGVSNNVNVPVWTPDVFVGETPVPLMISVPLDIDIVGYFCCLTTDNLRALTV
jgi:hypothetical protein